MAETKQADTLRTRRSLLTAAAGGAAALAVGAIRPAAVAAVPANMQTETDNATTAPTGVTNSTDDTTALFGHASGNGTAVEATTETGIGLWGRSSDASDPVNNPTNAGVVGIAGDSANVNTNIALTGVYGVSDPSPSEDFVASGVWGESAELGVIGSGAAGVLGDGVIGVFGVSAAPGGVGVYAATDDPSGFSLLVDGRAMFSRSGRTSVNSGSKKKAVNLAGCTVNTLVLAVLAQNRAGRWVRAVVPESGKFTVYLNNDVSNDTKVTWIAFTNPQTQSG